MSICEESTRWPEPGKGDLVALIAGFVSGQSLQEIATAAGVSVSTVQRRRRDPLVKQAIVAAQSDQRRRVRGQLGGAIRFQALEVLADLLEDKDSKVRLRAVTTVLAQSLRYELSDVEEPGLQHSTGTDRTADFLLARQLADDAWDVDLAEAEAHSENLEDTDDNEE